jgi:hypothetical protein
MKNKFLIVTSLVLFVLVSGCSNAGLKAVNPNSGTVTVYATNGTAIKSFDTDGMPQMHQGGHLYIQDKKTGHLVIVYGTYIFEEK